ncbi:MAG: hypothetical protein M3173_02405 [Chloroflexota bacterium]|nr:hypothetical protein [Chloroflexota bacterium]
MFNPQDHVTIVDGAAYLEVKWRLVWLREQHPDATIETEMVESSRDHAIFKAFVRLPNGASATGWGSEYREQFFNFIEAAETKAIGRALAALGFGTQFAGDYSSDSGAPAGLSDAPVRLRAVEEGDRSRPQPQSQQAGELEPTERQRKLIDVLRSQINITVDQLDELAMEHGGAPMESIGRKGVSALITELQRIKQEKQERAKAS